jgi:glycosyltransferase involved in cell wall biosynthesis
MKVLMSADTVGGVFTYATELIAGLRERGVEVSLATFGAPPTPSQQDALRAAGVATCHESSLSLEWMGDPWRDLRAAEELLLELEQREAPDVVHLNAYAHGAAAFAAPVLVTGHSCVLSWWQAVHGERAPAAWDRYRRTVSAGIRSAGAVVAPSRWMLAQLREHYGPLPPGSRTILNGGSTRTAAAAGKGPLVLAAGRMWDAAKNLDALVGAARIMSSSAEVAVAGDLHGGNGTDGGRRAALGPSDMRPARLRLLGPLDRHALAHWRARAAIFAAPARYEPFGLGILEAARDRCALVLGDIPPLRELWEDSALYVPPEDTRALAAALDELIEDPGRAAALGAHAQQHSRRYTVAAMADRYLALYHELCVRREEMAA